MSGLAKTGTALGILLSVTAIVTVIGGAWKVPFRLDALSEQLKEWKVSSHDARLSACEAAIEKLAESQEKQIKATGDLHDSIVAVGTEMKVGMTEIKTIVSGMVAGVDNANRVALRAESLVIDHNVKNDFREDNESKQPLRGK